MYFPSIFRLFLEDDNWYDHVVIDFEGKKIRGSQTSETTYPVGPEGRLDPPVVGNVLAEVHLAVDVGPVHCVVAVLLLDTLGLLLGGWVRGNKNCDNCQTIPGVEKLEFRYYKQFNCR